MLIRGGGNLINMIKSLPCGAGIELTEGDRLHPRLRFHGFTDDWQEKRLGECFILRNGYTPSKDNRSYWTNGTIPWFRMDDIREQGHILRDSSQKVTIKAVKDSSLFPAGSFILSTSATIGEHALLLVEALANQRFTVLVSSDRWTTLSQMYFYQYCFILGDWCRKNVNVGGFDAVNILDLREHKIPYPSLAEQEQIGSFFLAQDEGIAGVEAQLAKLRTMKSALLERMFA